MAVNKNNKTGKASVANRDKNGKIKPIALFERSNYYFMIGGFILIIIGFLLMTGAKVSDPNTFDRSEIYSFRRITLAPITIIVGFIIEAYAIMKKPKRTETEEEK